MERHETVQHHDDERLNRNWWDGVTVADKYEQYRTELLKLLEKFEDMCDGHLGQTKMAKHRIELTHNDVRPIHSAPYREGHK